MEPEKKIEKYPPILNPTARRGCTVPPTHFQKIEEEDTQKSIQSH
jgi:hypothetical protein